MQRCRIAYSFCLGLVLMLVSNAARAQYQLTNLDSNQVGAARHTDPLIVNAWGLVHAPGSPWWVSDNNSGWSTLYDANGAIVQQLKVLVPTGGKNGPGSPTGIVSSASTTDEFKVQGWPSVFLFATLDGTFSLVTSFTDTTLPAGFAPFGIRHINGLVYVTFASVSGGNGGFVDVFSEDGTPVTPGEHLLQGAPLNQPWGIAAAPGHFGPLSNTLLISNNTNSGSINAFDPLTKKFVGAIKDTNGNIIRIDQLWGIDFGDGTKGGENGGINQMFFTSGPSSNLAGTFGTIVFKP